MRRAKKNPVRDEYLWTWFRAEMTEVHRGIARARWIMRAYRDHPGWTTEVLQQLRDVMASIERFSDVQRGELRPIRTEVANHLRGRPWTRMVEPSETVGRPSDGTQAVSG